MIKVIKKDHPLLYRSRLLLASNEMVKRRGPMDAHSNVPTSSTKKIEIEVARAHHYFDKLAAERTAAASTDASTFHQSSSRDYLRRETDLDLDLESIGSLHGPAPPQLAAPPPQVMYQSKLGTVSLPAAAVRTMIMPLSSLPLLSTIPPFPHSSRSHILLSHLTATLSHYSLPFPSPLKRNSALTGRAIEK